MEADGCHEHEAKSAEIEIGRQVPWQPSSCWVFPKQETTTLYVLLLKFPACLILSCFEAVGTTHYLKRLAAH
jgi:hypothetical protein